MRRAPQAMTVFWSFAGTLLVGGIVSRTAFGPDESLGGHILTSILVGIMTCVFGVVYWESLKVQFRRIGFDCRAAWIGLAMTQVFLLLSIKRGTNFPAGLSLDSPVPENWGEALALQGLIKGYVRCEIYDTSGLFLYDTEVRVKGLQTARETAAFIRLPQGVTSPEQILVRKPTRTGRIVFTH